MAPIVEPFFLGELVTTLIFVDESGDLGWSFDKTYGHGGSSRFLTIAAMILPDQYEHIPKRKIRHFYDRWKWDTKREKKWTEMHKKARSTFSKEALNLAKHANLEINYKAIVVKKENVNRSYKSDNNKLYNYMLKILLLEEMTSHKSVSLIPDSRPLKINDELSLHHYLEMMLYEKEADTKLETISQNSKSNLCLQFVDMLAGVIQVHFENGESIYFNELSSNIEIKRLFF